MGGNKTMTLEEMIAVLTHYKNGGKVQIRPINTPNWYDFDVIQSWDFTNVEYRAKPEPQVIYGDFSNGRLRFFSGEKYTPPFGRKLKKFVEVEE